MTDKTPFSAAQIHDLAGLRDELRLQAHLFRADLKDRWADAEQRWQGIEHELRAALDHSRSELSAATQLTAEALRETYQDFRQALKSI